MHKDLYDAKTVDTVFNNFYVDDCLVSVPTDSDANNWISNSRTVLNAIPEEDRDKKVKNTCQNDTSRSVLRKNWLGQHYSNSEYIQRCTSWLEELYELEKFEVLRCLKPENFGETTSAQLHHFSDASDKGYGHGVLFTTS